MDLVGEGPEQWRVLGGGREVYQGDGIRSDVGRTWRWISSSPEGPGVRCSKESVFYFRMLSRHLGQEQADGQKQNVTY